MTLFSARIVTGLLSSFASSVACKVGVTSGIDVVVIVSSVMISVGDGPYLLYQLMFLLL